MINKQSFNLIAFVVVSSLILSGCINSPQQGLIKPTATPTQNLTGMNDYLEEIKTNIHAFGPFNSSSSASIYISPGHEVNLIVPLMLDENGEILKMYNNPVIKGNITASIVNTEYGKALRIIGTGGEIKMVQDEGMQEDESVFLDGFKITMTNDTAIDLNSTFTYQANVYSGYNVQDFRLFFSRAGGQSGKIVFVRTEKPDQASRRSTKLGNGWVLVNLYGDSIRVK